MRNEEILETSEDGNYRVRLVLDEYADEPFDDRQSPLMRIDGERAEHIQIGSRPTDDDDRIEEAVNRWGSPSNDDWPLVEKYLHAYYGVTKIETWYSGSYWYVTYDSAAWQKFIGVGDPQFPDFASPGPNMDEYKAWCEGEVYDYVVEKRVTTTTIVRELDGTEIRETVDNDWEDVDSCGGYYGYDYAEETAQEALAAASEPATRFTRGPEPAAMTDR